jgi:hypothetical protein
MRTRNAPAGQGDLPIVPTVPPVDRSTVAVVAGARLLRVEPGLHSLVVAPARAATRRVSGMSFPAVFVTIPKSDEPDGVELVSAPGTGSWIGAEGGSIVLRAPARGGHVLVTAYTLPDQATEPFDVELQPIDGTSPVATEAATRAPSSASLRAEIVLHIEREGDRQFAAGGWAGRIGSHLRVEALAVRPLETISRGEIEYKVYAHGGRETPWVGDGRLCGSRGQGLPLTGFAIRLAPHLRDGFDVIYRGAFFSSGLGPIVRNGEPCFASVPDDTLEAVEVRIIEHGAE